MNIVQEKDRIFLYSITYKSEYVNENNEPQGKLYFYAKSSDRNKLTLRACINLTSGLGSFTKYEDLPIKDGELKTIDEVIRITKSLKKQTNR